ncbi:MAG: PorP/SprF family type IX secretion system membrane protein [Saprospiraceae bacterium]|jgi:type IX secretion system PorP/SprF family membrane protein|nr:PorP/SprF family type IX secretion system membrane protein [Candidatus Brachybacter algidus]
MPLRLFISLLLITISTCLSGQQIANWSSFYENGFIWNPALTAKWTALDVSLSHQQMWTGFDGAPQYSTLSFQYPFYKYGKSSGAGIGLLIEQDKVGPFAKLGAGLSYSFRLEPQLFGNSEDMLSLGVAVRLGKYSYSPDNVITYDGLANDPNLMNEIDGSIKPNFSAGFYYMSAPSNYALQSHYYIGFSVLQGYPTRIFSMPELNTQYHMTLHLGYRYFASRRAESFIEPDIMVIRSGKNNIHAMANIRFEQLNRFWLAGGGATSGEIFVQTGVILNSDSFLGKFVQDGNIRIGVKADYTVGLLAQYGGIGYEAFFNYHFDM